MNTIEIKTSDVLHKLIHAIIDVIGRRSSEDYALVMVGNAIEKLQEKYPFLKMTQIKKTRYSEMENLVNIDSSIDQVNKENVGMMIQELIQNLVTAMGKNAGFFFIKEIKNKIGPNYEMTIRNMGVDFNFMQFSFEIDKKQTQTSTIEHSDILSRVLKTFIDVIEKQHDRSYALDMVISLLEKYKEKYAFLSYIKIIDVRYTLGGSEISIDPKIDQIEREQVGKAIQDLMIGIQHRYEEQQNFFNIEEFKQNLTIEYQNKLIKMGVNLDKKQSSHSLIYKQVIKALLTVLSNASTQRYAVFALNSFLKKMDSNYTFIKHIKITTDESDDYTISIMSSFDDISDTDMRRSIQKLLEEIINSLGEELRQTFIGEFKDSLEKSDLARIEEMGVNLHMIQLKQELLR